MGQVLNFNVPPKKLTRNYKQQKYTVTYVPDTREWRWRVEMIQTTVFEDVETTQIKAFRAAEKHIDNIKRLQGAA